MDKLLEELAEVVRQRNAAEYAAVALSADDFYAENKEFRSKAVRFIAAHHAEIAEAVKDRASVCAVLSVVLGPRPGVHGQVIGADGAGEYAFVFYGDEQVAEEMARQKIRQIEQSGQRVKQCIFAHGEGYSGPNVLRIDAAIDAQHNSAREGE